MKLHVASFRRTVRNNACRGISLLESMVALSIITLLGLGFMTLYINMVRSGATVRSMTIVTADAGNAIGVIESALREARRFELMEGGTYGTTYLATDGSGNGVAITGIRIIYPAYKSDVRVVTSTGNLAMSGTRALMDIRNDGAFLEVYRSDENGTAAPNTGNCLWARGTLNKVTLPVGGRILIKNVADVVGAVQFIQPYAPGSTTPLANQVRIKVTTSTYDRVRGSTSSEASKGKQTALTGEHAFLRNHDPNGVTSGAAHGKTQYVAP